MTKLLKLAAFAAAGVALGAVAAPAKVTTVPDGDVSGTWYKAPGGKSLLSVYADKSSGAVAVGFYRDEAKAGKGCDFAISATEAGVNFQVVDPKGQVHIFPASDLLKLKALPAAGE